MSTHYIGMAGLHGSLPQFCSSYDRKDDAVSDLASLHELGRTRTSKLKKHLYLELNLRRDGNEYCEITECDCSNPEDHTDSYLRFIIAKAKLRGCVYENFGQKELSALKDKCGYNPYPANGGERALKRDIDELNNWCMNYTGRG